MISPRPRLVPAALEELRLEQPGEADVVGEVLDLGRLALAGRGVLGEVAQVLGQRLVGDAELAEERAVDDQVRVTADRAREMAVGRAREAGVAEVARVVAGLLERPEYERGERLPPTAGLGDVLGHAFARRRPRRGRRRRPSVDPATAGSARRGRPAWRRGETRTAGRAARERGRAPPGCGRRAARPTASFAMIISSSTSACASGSPSHRAAATPPSPSKSNAISGRSTRSAPRANRRRRSSAEYAAASSSSSDNLGRNVARAAPGRRSAGRRCGSPSGRRAARRPGRTRRSRTSRSTCGRSEHASSESSGGSIGATRPGT